MRRVLLGSFAAIVGVASTMALGADDPILARQKLMYANGAVFYGVAGGMIKGEIPYNPIVPASILRTTNAVAHNFGDHFPEGSETGRKTKASPRIWEDITGFQAQLAKFKEVTDATAAAKPQTLEEFQAIVSQIGPVCKSCHDDYRLEDD